jgi:hypothetical protein
MHAEPAMMEQGDGMRSQDESAEGEAEPRYFGGLLDVLMPATPPEPKNARIIRQFDIEAGKTDERPVVEVASRQTQAQPERRSRDEARALRNRSLRAAAGLD